MIAQLGTIKEIFAIQSLKCTLNVYLYNAAWNYCPTNFRMIMTHLCIDKQNFVSILTKFDITILLNSRTIPSPIPLEPPVTITTLSSYLKRAHELHDSMTNHIYSMSTIKKIHNCNIVIYLYP